MEYNKELDSEELRFFMTGGISIDENLPEKPDAPWILDKMWAELVRLNDLPSFKGFLSDFIQNLDEWSLIYNNEMPYEIEFPGDWDDKLTSF